MKNTVVMQYLQRIQPVLIKKALHLGGSVPPIVVVAFHQNLLSRQMMDKLQIL